MESANLDFREKKENDNPMTICTVWIRSISRIWRNFFFFIFPFCPILKLHVYPAVTAILDFWSTHKTHILLRTIQIIFQQYYVSLNIRNGWWGTVDYAWFTVNCDSWGINKTEARYVFHIFSSSLGICSFILTSIFT